MQALFLSLIFLAIGCGLVYFGTFSWLKANEAESNSVISAATVKAVWITSSRKGGGSPHLVARVQLPTGKMLTADVEVARRQDVYDLNVGDAVQLSVVPGNPPSLWLATNHEEWSRMKWSLIPFGLMGLVFAPIGALMLFGSIRQLTDKQKMP